MLSHQDYQGIHEQRESAAFPGPWNLHLIHSAVFAFSTRNAAMNIGFKLKEIQVTPCSFDRIMYAAVWFAAFSTRKFAA
jgi:hypothetical protein